TSAAQDDNPEIQEARRRGIRIVKRYDFFPELTKGKKTIAIAGTHGKTTTTGMVATILTDAGLDPTAIVGGIIPELGGNARAGKGDYFVVEADEYDRAFLGLVPTIAVVTSIELDHPDIYRDLDEIARAFHQFLESVPPDGLVIGWGDSERVLHELVAARAPFARYGFGADDSWRASDVKPNGLGGSDFSVWHENSYLGDFHLQIPGTHNVLNALAALIVADRVGVNLKSASKTLARFRGAERRFQIKGEFRGITIVDDYAHHPTEIRATLAAARSRFPGKRIWTVFQPHTFTRTKALLDDFANAFGDADHVIVVEVFAARERDSMGISGAQIVARMRHADAHFIATLDDSVAFLERQLTAGDVLVTLGAGNVDSIGVQLALAWQGDRNG
ncbi:MAG TPA: UDP-N-acetylmuramate--L-alanine ligase, partial [Anaerolineae bacterium]